MHSCASSCAHITESTRVNVRAHVRTVSKASSNSWCACRHNRIYLYTYVAATLLWIVNMVVSAALVHLYRLDTRTATVFVTNNLLLLTRWSKGLAVYFFCRCLSSLLSNLSVVCSSDIRTGLQGEWRWLELGL
jgi:hypothetical protein